MKKKLWRLRDSDGQFVLQDSVKKFFCDAECGGGVCDTEKLVCEPREQACKPWWWCGHTFSPKVIFVPSSRISSIPNPCDASLCVSPAHLCCESPCVWRCVRDV